MCPCVSLYAVFVSIVNVYAVFVSVVSLYDVVVSVVSLYANHSEALHGIQLHTHQYYMHIHTVQYT